MSTAHTNPEHIVEHFDDAAKVKKQAKALAKKIKESKHFCVFTGAGISTSAGIPDYRGPEGAWTLKAQGRKRTKPTVACINAFPTKTHMALVALQEAGLLKHVISQNTDGLHRRVWRFNLVNG